MADLQAKVEAGVKEREVLESRCAGSEGKERGKGEDAQRRFRSPADDSPDAPLAWTSMPSPHLPGPSPTRTGVGLGNETCCKLLGFNGQGQGDRPNMNCGGWGRVKARDQNTFAANQQRASRWSLGNTGLCRCLDLPDLIKTGRAPSRIPQPFR